MVYEKWWVFEIQSRRRKDHWGGLDQEHFDFAITVAKESFEKCAAEMCCNAAECSVMANHIVDRFNDTYGTH